MTSALRNAADQDSIGVPVESLSPPTRRRPSWLAGGVLLVAVAALLGAWLFASATSTISVTVAAHDLPPGHVVTKADLRAVEISRTGDMRAVQLHQQDLIVGAAARSLIPAGTVLHTGLFVSTADAVPDGKVVVGAAFTAGAAPVSGLRPGDQVVLLAVVPANANTAELPPATALGAAQVWAVEGQASTASASQKVWVSLLVDRAIEGDVAQAAAADRLRLGLVAP